MIVAGFGFRASASTDSLAAALAAACAQTPATPTALAAPPDKAEAPALLALAARLGLPLLPVPHFADLPTLSHSPLVAVLRGTGSVAEASALTAAGPGARLLAPRALSPDRLAVCALARAAPSGAP